MKYSTKGVTENKDLSISILREAVPKMTALDIAVTPMNYAVWYEYCVGSNPRLNKEIDKLLNTKAGFNPTTNQKLYRDFLTDSADSEKLNAVQTGTQSLISGLLKKLSELGKGTVNFSEVLGQFNEQLQDSPDEATLNRLVEGIGSELEHVIAQNKDMAQSLVQMDAQVNQLKGEMDALQSEALTDPLTTLYNRRAFDQHMQQLLLTPEACDAGFCMMVVDIDFFKKINDTYGHQAGDKVLAYIGRLLKRCVRQSDFVARFGGEEFVVVLPATSFGQSMEIAEIVRLAINEKNLSVGGEQKTALGKISVSIGVSSHRIGEELHECFERADQALYQAKQTGRNKVCGDEMKAEVDLPAAAGH